MTVGQERSPSNDPVPPRRFWFRPNGVIVAEGTIWSDGAVALYTPGALHTSATYDSLVDLLADHRIADPANSIQWLDVPPVMAGVEWFVSTPSAGHGAAQCVGVGE